MSPQHAFLNAPKERYLDFVVTKVRPIKELQCVLRELVHEPSGAQVIHIENDDPENLFCLSFKTLPQNSHGTPHILEHTVLCGSRKFPVKDPFFAMNRRSLNTFMNALTGSDFTCYPAASQVEKDFYNLLDVYIDAVFHPRLTELSFLQEGHRLEFSDAKDPQTPLEYKGIVFNEMKGSMASADARLWHKVMQLLVPDLPYAYNSGGEPEEIPNLTYRELIEFHETYYHPSRCLFFFYGNFPLKKHLEFIAERALKNVLKLPPLPPIQLQKRFSKPVIQEIRYPIHETEDLSNKSIIAFAWLTMPISHQEEILALSTLDSILMDTDASLLKRVLLRSGLCIQADAFMDTEMSEIPYALVCKGCKPENADRLEEVIRKALQEIILKGIPQHLIEASIHQLEFSRMEITGDQAPFGLNLFMRSALPKQNGCNPENALMVHSLFEELAKRAKDPHYLTGLLEKYLLNNPHFVRLTMIPDPHLASEETAEEKKKLHEIQKSLNEKQIDELLKKAEELAVYQRETQHQQLDCLPKVTLADVPLLNHDFPLTRETYRNLQVFHHPCFTNHILYVDLIFNLPAFEEADLPFIPLLSSLLPEIGAGSRGYEENLEYLHAHTGGVGASCALHVQVDKPQLTNPCLTIRGKALHRKADKLIALMKDMVLSPHYDEAERIEELILQFHNSLHNRLTRNALRYAIQMALSGFSTAGHINDLWFGLKYFKNLESLTKHLKKQLPELISKILELKKKLFSLIEPHLVLSCDEELFQQLKNEQFYGLADLPLQDFKPWNDTAYPVSAVTSQAKIISSPVAFNAQAFQTIGYLHPHAPALSVATHLFENVILHAKVREQGGAYGCGATFLPSTHSFYFHSYRDPHIFQTLQTFRQAIETIANGDFTETQLEEAKLGIIQNLDVPVSPGNRALTAYSWWRDQKTKERRQKYRNDLLSLNSKTVQHAVQEHLLSQKNSAITVCFAGKELLEKENALLAKEDRALPISSI